MNEQAIRDMALKMRRSILDISHTCNLSAHLGGGLSMVDITATLYGSVMRFQKDNPAWEGRDRFILSKGHGVLGYFSALLAAGIISEEKFATFQTNESDLIAHPVMNMELGMESSNGSLGQGLSLGVGLALAAKKKGMDHKIYVLLGDGECNEGSVWEAVMCAAQLKLDNLVAIVDYNRLQSDGAAPDIIDFGNFEDKWKAFGWNVCGIDGHNIPEIHNALVNCQVEGKPKVLVAHTVKGKGVKFMENNNEWHHNRLTKTHYEQALIELEGN
ncbi:transketolase [Pseudoduganella ginsengisoli]|uniref:Transketolase n=1 Tax=Pseudoduganella ginsengisoli TaxID=1462440 RepID=A0A6L6PTF4_9BURK|nr:transketolase [Pseudoduganella ginsengisoli]MTW00496.1 transketolase [Pseudoduganella ginsengisoli]